MALTPEQRAELKVLGPEIVRIRMMASDKVAVIPGFVTAATRSDVESWLREMRGEGESNHRQWWWASLSFVVVSLATAVVLLSFGVKIGLLAIYIFSGCTGWFAGAAAYFSWSVLDAHRKKKHRFLAWLLFCVSAAALGGFVWWLQYTVRFDLASPAVAITNSAPTVAPEPGNPLAPVAPEPTTQAAPMASAPLTTVQSVAPEPATQAAPVASAPLTTGEPVAPVTPSDRVTNPSVTCTRSENVISCK